MTLSVATVRARLAASLEAISGWTESRWTGPGWPFLQETREAHLRFAVWPDSTSYPVALESARGRRPDDVGSLVTTTFRVWWAYRLRADAAVSDTDSMLAQEDLAVEAILGTSRTGGLRAAIVRRGRTIAGDGTYAVCEIEIAVLHQVAI